MPLPAGLARKRVEALYRCDERGRLLSANYWDGRNAPRFFLMRTRDEVVCRFRADVPGDLAVRLEDLTRLEPLGAATQLPVNYDRYLDLLSTHALVETIWSGPAYLAACDGEADAGAVAIGEHNSEVLRENFPDWLPDVAHCRPFVAVVDDGRAVSLCASVRISESVHCAGAETHAGHRRKGHAANAVRAWAREVRGIGAEPFYSTSWENIASQNVADRLGFPIVGVDFHVT